VAARADDGGGGRGVAVRGWSAREWKKIDQICVAAGGASAAAVAAPAPVPARWCSRSASCSSSRERVGRGESERMAPEGKGRRTSRGVERRKRERESALGAGGSVGGQCDCWFAVKLKTSQICATEQGQLHFAERDPAAAGAPTVAIRAVFLGCSRRCTHCWR
jgi:hypothetical protein